MTRSLLYNFSNFKLPNGVQELLDLLGFVHVWDRTTRMHRIYEQPEKPLRMKWKVMEFRGGGVRDWQSFLSQITAAEHMR